MGDYITEKILNLKDEILKWAAPKVHSHPEYESNNTIPNHADVSNKYGQGTDKLYGHVKVDSVLKEDSINPIQNRKVTEAINNKSVLFALLSNSDFIVAFCTGLIEF